MVSATILHDVLIVLAAFGKVALYVALIVAAALIYGALAVDWSNRH